MSTVLVTGATGTLGREVVRQLLERGQHVRIYARQPHPSVPPNVEVFQGDIRLGTGLHEAVKGVDTIVHCVSVFEFEQGYPTDIEGAGHLIEAARAHGSPHLIFVSIVGIDHSPFSYFQAKLKVERMIERNRICPGRFCVPPNFIPTSLASFVRWKMKRQGSSPFRQDHVFNPLIQAK